jgi:hypothetical protein
MCTCMYHASCGRHGTMRARSWVRVIGMPGKMAAERSPWGHRLDVTIIFWGCRASADCGLSCCNDYEPRPMLFASITVHKFDNVSRVSSETYRYLDFRTSRLAHSHAAFVTHPVHTFVFRRGGGRVVKEKLQQAHREAGPYQYASSRFSANYMGAHQTRLRLCASWEMSRCVRRASRSPPHWLFARV